MVAIRAPFSALCGALFSAALFFALWQLVDVPMDASIHLPTVRPELGRVRPATPPETKRKEKVTRETPVLPPAPPKGTGGDKRTVDVRYTPPPVTVVVDPDGPRRYGVDNDVVPIIRPSPAYPVQEAYRGVEGWVRVQFSVTSIGTVRDAVVVDSEPGTVFDDAALGAIARWRYNPRVVNGEAVERVGLQTVIRFELEE